MKKKIEEL